MSFDLRRIAEAQKKALVLVESPDRRQLLEQFLEGSAPLVEAAARDMLQELVEEINHQLAPYSRLRLVQEGSKVMPEIVSLGEEISSRRKLPVGNGTVSKVLVRMPSNVKTLATEAAQKAGTSLNSWTVNVLERAVVNLREHQQGVNQPPSRSDGTDTSNPNDQPNLEG